jgi:hypothetical protein
VKTVIVGVIVFVLIVIILSFATNSPQQIIGRLAEVSGHALVLSPLDDSGQPLTIALTPATHFIRGGTVATADDLKPGSWIVVIARRNFGKTVALMIVIGKHSEESAPTLSKPRRSGSMAWG